MDVMGVGASLDWTCKVADTWIRILFSVAEVRGRPLQIIV